MKSGWLLATAAVLLLLVSSRWVSPWRICDEPDRKPPRAYSVSMNR